ncbi:MAG TPA: hypothetical protein VMH30_06230 [Verrucomicrobiae bacterium]|nr:hypothetical protein [Verrucomicrobiae bacterium]
MKYEKKFRQQEHQQISAAQSHLNQTAHEFATPEEMLRHDAKQTQVPPQIAHRLSQSLQNEPLSPRPWWKRWLQ